MGNFFCAMDPLPENRKQQRIVGLWQEFAVAYREYVLAVWANVYLNGETNPGDRKPVVSKAGRLGLEARMDSMETMRDVFKYHARLICEYADANFLWAKRGDSKIRKEALAKIEMLKGPDKTHMCRCLGDSIRYMSSSSTTQRRNDEQIRRAWGTYLEDLERMVAGLSDDMKNRRESVSNARADDISAFQSSTQTLATQVAGMFPPGT